MVQDRRSVEARNTWLSTGTHGQLRPGTHGGMMKLKQHGRSVRANREHRRALKTGSAEVVSLQWARYTELNN